MKKGGYMEEHEPGIFGQDVWHGIKHQARAGEGAGGLLLLPPHAVEGALRLKLSFSAPINHDSKWI